VPQWVPAMYHSRAAASMSADLPSVKTPTTQVYRRISRMIRSSGLLVWTAPVLGWKLAQRPESLGRRPPSELRSASPENRETPVVLSPTRGVRRTWHFEKTLRRQGIQGRVQIPGRSSKPDMQIRTAIGSERPVGFFELHARMTGNKVYTRHSA
jgi:hypothetical protein